MKLFCCSDLHSFYWPLEEALNKVGFDSNNPEHWLIVCGDVFDRGPESEEILHYLMTLERKILIKGNHEVLLEECCEREFPYSHDISNGTLRTINDLGGAGEGLAFDDCCRRTLNKTIAYRDLLVNYFETENYIFVHSWIPTTQIECDILQPDKNEKSSLFYKDWRCASQQEWEQAMWVNPFEMANQGLNQTSKWLVVGHWHCSTGWAKKEARSEFGPDAKWDIYKDEKNKVIFIDKCTAYTGEVNILVLEDNLIDKAGIK